MEKITNSEMNELLLLAIEEKKIYCFMDDRGELRFFHKDHLNFVPDNYTILTLPEISLLLLNNECL